MSIGGLPALNDGNVTRCDLYNHLIDKYGVQIVHLGGQQRPGHQHRRRSRGLRRHDGDGRVPVTGLDARRTTAPTPYDDNLHYFSSRGPREDGGFKPQIIAPGSAVSTIPCGSRARCRARTRCPPATRCSTARRWRRRRPRAGGAADQAAQQSGAQHRAGAAPQGAQLVGALHDRPLPGVRAGQRPDQRRRPPGTC